MNETLTQTTPLSEEDPDVADDFERCVWKAMHRTPEEIAAARWQLEPYFIPGRPLPPGKTLEDVFVGAIKAVS